MRRFWLASVVVVLGWFVPAQPSASGDEAVNKASPTFEVETLRDLAYYDGPDADAVKHKLDLYLPIGKKDFPVLFFVHGGAWRSGDKRYFFDVYGNIGRAFARQGIGTVVTNYRLSPKVQHPKHIEDVAKAFAWTHKHIGKHGGRADRIFVCGHSAGGHLVALLATHERYLKAEQLALTDIKGAIPLSGVYTIPPGRAFGAAFGEDAEQRRQASPLVHATGKHPPFLIAYADRDFPTCDRVSEEFCTALGKCGCDARTLEVKDRDHLSIIAGFSKQEDPTFQAAVSFIKKHTMESTSEKSNGAAK